MLAVWGGIEALPLPAGCVAAAPAPAALWQRSALRPAQPAGAYDVPEQAGCAHDLMALKTKPSARPEDLNFPPGSYAELAPFLQHMAQVGPLGPQVGRAPSAARRAEVHAVCLGLHGGRGLMLCSGRGSSCASLQRGTRAGRLLDVPAACSPSLG